MSMIGNYRRVKPAELQQLLSEPESISDFLYADDVDSSHELDIDKTWNAIHFLLTGSQWEGEYPLSAAVLGGKELGTQDVGYGPARYLSPKEVGEVAAAIADISAEQLLSGYDSMRRNKEQIYPGWQDADADREYIGSYYTELVQFFQEASSQGDAMILYIN